MKSKEINRGANYFIEKEKMKKDAEVQKIGASYVLLACQIISFFGKWYSIDEDKEKTRFADYYRGLTAKGVHFGDGGYNFFKKDDGEKFRKNYTKWLKWYVEKVKEEELEETTKGVSEKNTSFSPVEKVESENDKNEGKVLTTVKKDEIK